MVPPQDTSYGDRRGHKIERRRKKGNETKSNRLIIFCTY